MSKLIELCPFGHFLSTIRQLRRHDSDMFLSILTLFSVVPAPVSVGGPSMNERVEPTTKLVTDELVEFGVFTG